MILWRFYFFFIIFCVYNAHTHTDTHGSRFKYINVGVKSMWERRTGKAAAMGAAVRTQTIGWGAAFRKPAVTANACKVKNRRGRVTCGVSPFFDVSHILFISIFYLI